MICLATDEQKRLKLKELSEPRRQLDWRWSTSAASVPDHHENTRLLVPLPDFEDINWQKLAVSAGHPLPNAVTVFHFFSDSYRMPW